MQVRRRVCPAGDSCSRHEEEALLLGLEPEHAGLQRRHVGSGGALEGAVELLHLAAHLLQQPQLRLRHIHSPLSCRVLPPRTHQPASCLRRGLARGVSRGRRRPEPPAATPADACRQHRCRHRRRWLERGGSGDGLSGEILQ